MRRLLSPSWVALHVLAILLVIAFIRLGWWQWERATAPTGSVRSYGYALQWPAFAVFVVFMWVKMVRDELRPPDRAGEAETAATSSAFSAAPGARRTSGAARPGASPAAHSAGDMPGDPAQGFEGDSAEDAELAAYNRYLARLNARAERRG